MWTLRGERSFFIRQMIRKRLLGHEDPAHRLRDLALRDCNPFISYAPSSHGAEMKQSYLSRQHPSAGSVPLSARLGGCPCPARPDVSAQRCSASSCFHRRGYWRPARLVFVPRKAGVRLWTGHTRYLARTPIRVRKWRSSLGGPQCEAS